MADKVLARSSLFFDALNKVRVIEPDDYEASEQSVDEARLFTGRVDQFLNHAQTLVALARQLGAEVERHKLSALALRNSIASVERDKETLRHQLQLTIAEKQAVLDRVNKELHTLRALESEQMDMMQQLIDD